MTNKVDILDIRAIDRQLKKLEESFKKKLDAFWSEYEKDVSKQISKLKAGIIKKIKLKDSKLTGLEKLYKEYFRAVDKIVQRITKANLLKNGGNSHEIERLSNLKVDKSKTDYLQRAKELSQKQYNDYQDILNNKFDEAKKIKPLMSSNDYKKIVAEETQKFKNIRLNLSAEHESNRIANNIREELAIKSGLVIGIVFNAIVDDRTTKHICLPRHKVVLKINDPRLIYFKPPLHPYCRSYWTYIYSGSNIKFTSDGDIYKIILLNTDFSKNKNILNIKSSTDNDKDFNSRFLDHRTNQDFPVFNSYEESLKFHQERILKETKNEYEVLVAIGGDGKFLFQIHGLVGRVTLNESDIKLISKEKGNFIHNHPDNGLPSVGDIQSFYKIKELYNYKLPDLRVLIDNNSINNKPAVFIFEGIKENYKKLFLKNFSKASNEFNVLLEKTFKSFVDDLINKNLYSNKEIEAKFQKKYNQISKILTHDFTINFYADFILKYPKSELKYRYEDI